MPITLDGTTGITTPGLTNTGTETLVNLTTTGNTTLGDASTDTLNVGNGGLVKDASGNVGIGTASPTTKLDVNGTVTTTSLNTPNTFGFKNRIMNGNMGIDQRNAGASVTLTTSATFPVDRWQAFEESDGVMTAQRVADAPTGFLNSIRFTTTTADPSLTGAERVYALQGIEGLNMIDLAWGTASAKTVTVSFWVKSSLTGTFGGSLRGNLNYPFSYTISSANTWEQKSVTIAGPTTGTWPTDKSLFVYVTFGMGIGPSLSGGGGAWTASNFIAPSGAVAVISTLNATFNVTGVQFETGSTATSFDVRPYGTELALCQRYFYKSIDMDSAIGSANDAGIIFQGVPATVPSTSYIEASTTFKQTMRLTPTITVYDRAGASGFCSRILTGVSSTNGQGIAAALIGQNGFYVSSTSGASASMVAFQFAANADF